MAWWGKWEGPKFNFQNPREKQGVVVKMQIPGAPTNQPHLPVNTRSVRDPASEKQGGWDGACRTPAADL